IPIRAPSPARIGWHGEVLVAGVPLGRLTAEQAEAIGRDVRVTPWRSLVLPRPGGTAGLVTDPQSPWLGVTACAGRPGCANALSDVRADAAFYVHDQLSPGPRIHWSGCSRRCGRPAGSLDVVATGLGYRVDGREARTVADVIKVVRGRR